MLFSGVLKSDGKVKRRPDGRWERTFRCIFCVAADEEEARPKLLCKVPAGWQLKAIRRATRKEIPGPVEEALQPWEVEELDAELGVPGRTLSRRTPHSVHAREKNKRG